MYSKRSSSYVEIYIIGYRAFKRSTNSFKKLMIYKSTNFNRVINKMIILYPTDPSSFKLNKRSASDANSSGNSLNTSLQNPLTINEIASSVSMPRCNR